MSYKSGAVSPCMPSVSETFASMMQVMIYHMPDDPLAQERA